MIDLPTLLMICSLYQDSPTVNSVVMLASAGKPYTVITTSRHTFQTGGEAAAYADQEMRTQGTVEIGLAGLPSPWLAKLQNPLSVTDLMRPCKNLVVATDVLNHALEHCTDVHGHSDNLNRCALSVYKTGSESEAGFAYADQVIAYSHAHPMPNSALNTPQGAQTDLYTNIPNVTLPEPTFEELTKDPQKS